MELDIILEITVLIAISVELYSLTHHAKLEHKVDEHILRFDEHLTRFAEHVDGLDAHMIRTDERMRKLDDHMHALLDELLSANIPKRLNSNLGSTSEEQEKLK